jgi:16S rRNA G527 N7-methylase RsmG
MMGVSPSEADRFSLHDYEELLYHWNEAHDTSPAAAPQPERARKLIDSINANPILVN